MRANGRDFLEERLSVQEINSYRDLKVWREAVDQDGVSELGDDYGD